MPCLYEVSKGYETRMRMLKALNQLMQGRSLGSITVSDICKYAGASRPTFYRYFSDIYDAVNWYNELFDQRSLIHIGRTLTWYEGHLEKLRWVLSEPGFFEAALKSQNDYNSLIHFVIRYTYTEYRKTIIEYNGLELTDLLDFQLGVWCKAAAEIAMDWIFDGMRMPPEELAALQDDCVPRELYEAMNRPVLKRRAKDL